MKNNPHFLCFLENMRTEIFHFNKSHSIYLSVYDFFKIEIVFINYNEKNFFQWYIETKKFTKASPCNFISIENNKIFRDYVKVFLEEFVSAYKQFHKGKKHIPKITKNKVLKEINLEFAIHRVTHM